MRVPIESIQYLLDVFLEGGYAEDEDLEYIDDIHEWLEDEKHKKRLAFKKRTVRDVNPDYTISRIPSTPYASGGSDLSYPVGNPLDWDAEERLWPNPLAQERAYPTDYPEPEEDEDVLARLAGRGRFKVTEADGTEYYFTP